eukprot:sb/3473570/
MPLQTSHPPLFSKTFMEKLDKFMEDQLQQYIKINESKNIFKSARTPITLFICLFAAYVAHAFLAALYLGPLALLANIVFWVSMATLAAWIGIKYRGDKPEIAEKIDEIAEIIWEQGLTPLYVVAVGLGTAAAVKHAQTMQNQQRGKKRS